MNHPNIIHVEPSTTGADGFPMEIGLVLHNGAAYCLVSSPEVEGFEVSAEAEQATGLTREVRERRGRPAGEVARELNRALGTETVYCDDHGTTSALLEKVFAVAGATPTFTVEPIQALLSEAQLSQWDRATAAALEEQRQIRNRASDKALILQQTYVRSAGLTAA